MNTYQKGYFFINGTTQPLFLQQFLPSDLHSVKVPLPAGTTLVSNTGTPAIDSTHYSQLVGKLIFLTITRPDISFAVNRIASYMSSRQQAHLDSAIHILRYLKGTPDFGLLYEHDKPLNISGYTDADWGTCPQTRRSIGAYLFTAANGPISWQSKRQLTVSRSSTESEYRALSDGVQEAVWLSRLLQELRVPPPSPTHVHHTNTEIKLTLTPSVQLHCNNQSALKLARNHVFHARSKHIEIHHHFVKERVLEGEIGLKFINTASQPADILTKPLGQIKFELHRNKLNLFSLSFLKNKH